jgi:hypothetical protein
MHPEDARIPGVIVERFETVQTAGSTRTLAQGDVTSLSGEGPITWAGLSGKAGTIS